MNIYDGGVEFIRHPIVTGSFGRLASWEHPFILREEDEVKFEPIKTPQFVRCEYCRVSNPIRDDVMFCLCCGAPLPLWEFFNATVDVQRAKLANLLVMSMVSPNEVRNFAGLRSKVENVEELLK